MLHKIVSAKQENGYGQDSGGTRITLVSGQATGRCRTSRSSKHRGASAAGAGSEQTYRRRCRLRRKAGDAIARIGGSWSFILSFLAFLLAWTLANTWLLTRDAFDPYPFIFLNLVLSMLAAIQAPVIMMSQNRQATRDRLDAAHDYEVNLKAEIEIMALHEKMDALRHTELVGMHSEIRAIAERLERFETLLTDRKTAE